MRYLLLCSLWIIVFWFNEVHTEVIDMARDRELMIPEGLHSTLVDMNVKQNGSLCGIEDDPTREKEYFRLNPDLPQPDFFLLGLNVPSATEIIKFLVKHPFIGHTDTIDPSFFSFPTMSSEEYQRSFSKSDERIQLGDFSLSYLFHPLAPRRIASTIKNPKVIMILRNPIDRAYSQYLLLTTRLGQTLSFEDIVQQEFFELEKLRKSFRNCYNDFSCKFTNCLPEGNITLHNSKQSSKELKSVLELKEYLRNSLLFRSMYDDMVERWIQAVGMRNILFLFHEDFYYYPKSCLKDIQDFLGISIAPEVPHDFPKQSEVEKEWNPLSNQSYDTLVDFFAPYNERLFKMINRADTDWKYHRSVIKPK